MERIGKYIILEEIGRGGMGRVYKARDPVIERDVAVKVILEQVLDVPEMRRRFYREARSAGRLAHENVVVVHDVGEEAGLPYIVMEFLEGVDLREAMAEGSLSIDDKLQVALGICEGLRYAHARGVIHRDVKPENVRLVEGNRVKIVDFGIARLETGTQTLTNASVGTPRYMSPEQIKGDEVDHRSDIFSFGVLFYELLTGDVPFSGDRVSVVIYKILNEEPEPIELHDPRLSERMQRILSKCLEKELARRYPNVGALIEDLERVAAARQETRTLYVPGDEAARDGERRSTLHETPAEPDVGDSASVSDRGRRFLSRPVLGVMMGTLLILVALIGVYALTGERGVVEHSATLAPSVAGAEGAANDQALDGSGAAPPADDPASDEVSAEDPVLDDSASNESAGEGVAPDERSSDEPPSGAAVRGDGQPGGGAVEGARPEEGADDANGPGAADREEVYGGPEPDSAALAAGANADAAGIDRAAREREARGQADQARAEMVSVKEAVPPVVHASGPYSRALDLEQQGLQAYREGNYDAAQDRFSLARGTFEDAAAPEIVVQAEASAIQERLRQAILEDEWGGVPPIIADGYFRHIQDIRSYWRINDVTLSDQSLRRDPEDATLTLPVTMTVHYVQPGGFDPGNYSLFFDWTWVNRAGVMELDRVELIRTSG